MNGIRRPVLTAITVLIVFVAFGSVKGPDVPAQGNNVFQLHAPPFVSVAHADEQAILSVIGDEGGIAAYFQAATAVDMVSVRDVFRTVEDETADYIVGSVEVLNYPESEDVHVYVHRDGWILAYYLAADPAAKVLDWRAYNASGNIDLSTKLENTLTKVAGYAVVNYPGCTYYDFRYPDATHMMLIADWVTGGTDSFQAYLPGNFTFWERSWALGTNDRAWYHLDGATISDRNCDRWCTAQGILTLTQLLPNQFHTIEVYAEGGDVGYAGLGLIYRVP